MKRFLIIVLLLCGTSVMAEDMSTQEVQNDQSYFTANLQKAPKDRQKQGISNHFTFFTINVQINGKIKDSDSANATK